MADDGDKTEEPTSKKLDDARRKGQVWKSRDLTGALVFFAGFFVMMATFKLSVSHYKAMFADLFHKISQPQVTDQDVTASIYSALYNIVLLSLPVAGGAALVGLLADFLQVGPLFALEPAFPKADKVNPIEGLKNLFSKKQLVELLKSTFKLSLAAYMAYGAVRSQLKVITESARGTPDQIMMAGGQIIYRMSMRIGFLFIVFAIFDLWWQRRVYMKDMMMSKDEVKREYKESEGDPHHKAKRKELHQEILEHGQMEDVASADVIVTNPTHYAVALRYDREKDDAPVILAKGMDARAKTIREIAAGNGVPLMENVPLAHALYRLEVNQAIPEGLYDAVAEVLNFVWAEKQRSGQAKDSFGA